MTRTISSAMSSLALGAGTMLGLGLLLVGCQNEDGADYGALENNLLAANEDAELDGDGDPGLDGQQTHNTGPLPEECAKIEGGDIGRDGVSITLGDVTVTVDEWVTKKDEQGEFIGFDYSVEGGAIWISVKCGTDVFVAEGDGTWIHPEGQRIRAISNIVFCIDDEEPAEDGSEGQEGGAGDGESNDGASDGGASDDDGASDDGAGDDGDEAGSGDGGSVEDDPQTGDGGGDDDGCIDCEMSGTDQDPVTPV